MQLGQVRDYLLARLPLVFVFLSGLGFSIQTLIVKLLAEDGVHMAFHCIAFRGCIQCLISAIMVYRSERKDQLLFGNSNFVRLMLFCRSAVGFLGIMFFFSAVQLIPMGDATVLTMLSPFIAAIIGALLLNEPWSRPEACATLMSLLGAVLVIKPPFLFGSGDASIHGSGDSGDSGGGGGGGGEPSSGSTTLGVIFGLCSSVTAGTAYIFIRILGTSAKLPWMNVTFSHALAQLALAVPAALIFRESLQQVLTLKQMGLMLCAGLVGGPSQILMTIGMQREKSATATAMRMSDVLFGFLWQSLVG
ncbi:hypothetical protein B484DRAFT_436638 [Ochromonadaceae sp. CCMP2298]|nr:hypothetical protein B484DRAFT_436638 [Ochromonadaceae sp. CCMP2298]